MIKIDGDKLDLNTYMEEAYCLDNFSAFCVEIDGVIYKTAEHAFQTIKFLENAPEIAEKIKNSFSPFEARNIAHANKSLRRKDWSEIKYDVMEKILFEKVNQNPYVKNKLISTGENKIVEDCGDDDDKDWGCGIDGTGQNNLGKIWMKIRKKLKD